jgi:hypothetical protein
LSPLALSPCLFQWIEGIDEIEGIEEIDGIEGIDGD